MEMATLIVSYLIWTMKKVIANFNPQMMSLLRS